MKVTAIAPWFGSKRTLAPRIVEVLGRHKAYWEPFCGSMAVLLAKPPCSFETANDLHGDLTNLAWVIQHDRLGPALYRRLRRVLFTEDHFEDCKDRIGDYAIAGAPALLNWPIGEESLERAYCFFVMSWMGRSGTIGTLGQNNIFTIRYTSSGGNQAIRFQAAVESIPAWRRRLRSVTILRRCGLELLERVPDDRGTAIYLDPPYLVKGASYEHDFTSLDHLRLAALASKFHKARVVISYYEDPKLAQLYPGWTKIDCARAKHLAVQGRRGAESKVAPEVLLVNGPASNERNAEGLFA